MSPDRQSRAAPPTGRRFDPAPIPVAPPDAARLLVRSLGLGLPPGSRTPCHAHPWGQLVLATSGVVTVATDQGIWVVPAHRAVWIPGGVAHELSATGAVALRTLYLRDDLVGGLSATCSVVPVSALLRELALEVLRRGHLSEDEPKDRRLAEVVVDQLALAREVPLDLPMPTDPRARAVAERVRREPSSRASLTDLARGSGAAPRTVERLFRAETGLSFGRWRQRARLFDALERLANGEPVTSVALAVGYDSPSAFIAMFKRTLGTTPRRWVHGEREV